MFSSLFNRVVGGRKKAKAHKTQKARLRPRLFVEQLEKRDLLAAFTPGNLVILQAGNSTTQYNTQGPLYLDEYTTTVSGAQVQQAAISATGTVGGTGNQPITIDLTAAAGNGQLNRTYDGAGLVFGGVDSTVNNGGYTLPLTPTGSANRVIAVVGNDPAASNFVNTTTYGPFYVGDDNRGGVAESLTGPVYSFGHPNQAGGAVSQGVLYFPGPNGDGSLQPAGTAGIGPQSGVQVSSETNIRGGFIGFDNRLYWTTAGATSLGLAGIYTSTVQNLPTGNSPGLDQPVVKALFAASKVGGMYLADVNGTGILSNGDRIYLLDDGTVGGAGTGGLYMSVYDTTRWGGSNAVTGQAAGWSPMVRIAEGVIDAQPTPQNTAQLRGLAGTVNADGSVQLYASQFDNVAGNNSYILGFTDNGAGNPGVLRIASATHSGTTATITLTDTLPASYAVGTWVSVNSVGTGSGAFPTSGGFNGVWQITAVSGNTFSYTDGNTLTDVTTPSGVTGLWLNTGTVGGASDPQPTPGASQIIQTFADGTLNANGKNAQDALRGVSFAPVAATTVSNLQVDGMSSETVAPGTNVTFSVNVSNPEAGVTLTGLKVTFIDLTTNTVIGQGTINGSGVASFTTTTPLIGNHTVSAYFAGGGAQALASANAGNTVQLNEAGSTASTTSLSATIGGTVTTQAAIGRTVTLTATPTTGATGTVSFYNGTATPANLIGNATITSGTAVLTTSFSVAGTVNIIAVYNGDNTYASSTSPTDTLTIAANATAAITTSANNTAVGATPTYTATLTGTLGTVAGTVQFFMDGVALGSAQTLNGSGVATITSTALTAGSHLITVTYTPAATSPYNTFAVTTSNSNSGTALIETALQRLTPGNLLAVQRGDGTVNLGSSGYLVFLDEYTPNGVLVQRIALPNADAGMTHALLLSGQNGAEGLIQKSANGQYLTIVGYDVPVGRQFVTSTFPYQYGRTIARIDANGNVDTSTVVNTTSPTSVPYNPSDVVSNDGTQFWLSSNLPTGDTTDTGILYTTLGSTGAATQVGPANVGAAAINIYGTGANAQLVTSGSSQDLNTVGTGLPTTAGQTLAAFPNLEAEYQADFPTGRAPEQFVFLNTNDGSSNNPNLAYVADQAYGLLKFWKASDGNWHLGQLNTQTFGQKLVFAGGATGVVATILNPGTAQAKVNIYVTGSNVQQANPNQIAFFQDQNGGVAGGGNGVDKGFSSGNFSTTAFVGGAQGAAAPSSPNGNMNFAGLALVPGFVTGNLVVTQVGTGSAALTGNATATFLDQFTTSGLAQGSITLPTTSNTVSITAATWASNVATITTASAHGFTVGEQVIVAGVTPSGYNGTVTITAVTSTTFSYALTTNPGAGTKFGTAQGALNALTEVGNATGEGYLTDSADGHTLSIAGYNQLLGLSTSGANRVIGEVNAAGAVDVSTQLPSQTGSVRVAISADGLGFWVATSSGVRYVPFGNPGSTPSTQVTAEVGSPTTVGIDNGQLWASAGAGAQSNGVPALDSPFQVSGSTPLPTDGGQAIVNPPPSFPTARDAFNNFPSTNQFWVSPDGKTILIADSRTDSSGGLLEYYDTLGSGSFTLLGQLQLNSVGISSTSEPTATATITGASWASNVATITAANSFFAGENVTIAGMAPTGYNGTFAITSANSTSFTYALTTNPGAATAFGTATVNTSVTVTTSGAHGFAVGQTVTISGDSVAGYNTGSATITSVADATHFTYNLASPGLAAGSGGFATSTDGGLRALLFDPSSNTVYATTTAASANRLVKITGVTTNGNTPTLTATVLDTAAANTAFRGVAFSPTNPGTTASTTTLAVTNNPATYGTGVTLTATVTGGATGYVSFRNNTTGAEIAAAPIVGGTATYVTAGNLFAAGSAYNIVAVYTGDATYAPSTSSPASTATINKANTGVSLGLSANPIANNVAETITATLTGIPAGTLPTGTVTFFDGGVQIGTPQPVGQVISGDVISFTATLSNTFATQGHHSITATYNGDNNFNTSTSGATDLLVVAPTTTAVTTSNANPGPSGASVTLTAIITSPDTTDTITGSVQFYDNLLAIGTAQTVSGPSGATASVTVTTALLEAANQLTPGVHSITAVYTPDTAGATHFYTSSGVYEQTVQAQAFGAADQFVYRVGDGTTPLIPSSGPVSGAGSIGSTIYVDEYTTAGVLVQSIILPSADGTGAQNTVHAVVGEGQQSATGQLSLSGDGQFLFLAGYDQNPINVATDPELRTNSVPRSVARIKYDGTVQTEAFTAGSSGVETASNFNGVYSPDGNQFYLSGSGSPSGSNGVVYFSSFAPSATLQSPTAVVTGNPGFTTVGLEGVAGSLYTVGASTNLVQKYAGYPIAAASTAGLPGVTTTTDPNQAFTIDAYFTHLNGTGAPAGINTMYLSDDGPSFANGHITKWALVSGTWNLVDTVTAGTGNTATSFYWLSGKTDGSGNVTLFSTYGNGGNAVTGPGNLYSISDTNGYNALIGTGGTHSDAVTTVASTSSTSNEVFRGVASAPLAAVASVAVNGSYAVTISTATQSGTTVTITTATNHGFVVGESAVITGVSVAGYNGTFAITAVTATTFTYTTTAGLANGTGGSVTVTGLGGAQRSMVDTIVYKFNQAVTLGANAFTITAHPLAVISTATESGTTVTITTATPHGLTVGESVNISGVSVAGYNGTFTITGVTATTISYTTASGLADGTGGSVSSGNVPPTVSYFTVDGGFTWVVTFSGTGVVGNSIADGVYDTLLNQSAVTYNYSGATLALSNRGTDTFYRLYGDSNGDHVVNNTDSLRFRSTFNKSVGQAGYLVYLDYNDDGAVNNTDSLQFRRRFNTSYSGFTPTI